MALDKSFTSGNAHLRVRGDTVLNMELTEAGWTAGATFTPSSPDLATPELSQIDIMFETDTQKDHLDQILTAYNT